MRVGAAFVTDTQGEGARTRLPARAEARPWYPTLHHQQGAPVLLALSLLLLLLLLPPPPLLLLLLLLPPPLLLLLLLLPPPPLLLLLLLVTNKESQRTAEINPCAPPAVMIKVRQGCPHHMST